MGIKGEVDCLKSISCAVIFLSCTYIGFYYGEVYKKKRSTQLNNVLKATLFLNNKVIYANTPMPEALKIYILQGRIHNKRYIGEGFRKTSIRRK